MIRTSVANVALGISMVLAPIALLELFVATLVYRLITGYGDDDA